LLLKPESTQNHLAEVPEKSFAPINATRKTLNDMKSTPMDVDPIESRRTTWCCNLCGYQDNLGDDDLCIYCQQGGRPQLITPPAPIFSKPSNVPPIDNQLSISGKVFSHVTETMTVFKRYKN
jgi:hypothetical protein